MVENDEQFATILAYIAQWADKLEGMRQYELQTANGLFPTLAAGPLSEIRKSLEIAHAYVNQDAAAQTSIFESAGTERGIADYEAGRTMTLDELQARMREHKTAVKHS